jgi:glycosyltransferase involved in cell wall biosynthesis
VGAGPLHGDLEKQAIELGLIPDAVEFRGAVADMKSVYQEADLLILTSDFEGTPNVVLEAMASGLPVVATQVGGLKEIIRNGETGYLVEPDSPETIERLLSLIEDSSLRCNVGMRARQYVKSEHSVERLPALLENLYSQALS